MVQAIRAQHIVVLIRKTADTHHTMVRANKLMQVHEFTDQLTAQQIDVVHLQHNAVPKLLLQQSP